MELVLAKVLRKSEGPRQSSYPQSKWENVNNQTGCAITVSDITPEKDLGLFFDLTLRSSDRKNYYSESYANFSFRGDYSGSVNFVRTKDPKPHIHFKSYEKQSFFYQNFYPSKTILLIRKINSHRFDTYFVNDNHPSYLPLLKQIEKIKGEKARGAVFLQFDFMKLTTDKSLTIEEIETEVETTTVTDNSQGRIQDPKTRVAVENYAEDFIKKYLSKKGINFIRKYGKPYDLLFDQGIRVEVKGSTLHNIYEVDVTENELLHANDQLKSQQQAIWETNTKVYLAVVEGIKVDLNYKVSEGKLVHFDIFKSPNIEKWRQGISKYFKKKTQTPISRMEKAKFKYKISKNITI